MKLTFFHLALVYFFALIFSLPGLLAQDVSQGLNRLKNLEEEKLQITGGLRLSGNFYNASGIDARRDDFQWSARANLNLNFLGINAPFNFAFSDANSAFGLPSYTFTGISPRYKWATLHAGDRSMSFSRYTMSGISFRGIGAEVRPGKWRAAMFYGALNRALANDLNAVGNLNGFYQRRGYGGKVGYGNDKTSIDLILFGANDLEDEAPSTDQGVATPLSNRVISVNARQQLTGRITATLEVAHAITNEDKTADPLTTGDQNFGNSFLGLITPNQSTTTGQAVRAGMYYTSQVYSLQTGYERVGRGFRTLGALFFNNDSERFTLGGGRSFLKNKLSLSINGGLERTNLDGAEQERTDRLIASVNANYRPTDKWTFASGYSNFRNDTKLRGRADPFSPIDSIFLAQVTQSVNATALRQLGTKDRPTTLSFVALHQRANSIVDDEVVTDNSTRLTTLSLNLSAGNPGNGFRYFAGIATNFTQLGSMSTRAISPSMGVTKTFFNNALSTQMRSALSLVSGSNNNNKVVNLSASASYRLASAHRLNFSFTYLNRFGAELATRNFSELYLQAGYGYTFGGSVGLPGRNTTPNTSNTK